MNQDAPPGTAGDPKLSQGKAHIKIPSPTSNTPQQCNMCAEESSYRLRESR